MSLTRFPIPPLAYPNGGGLKAMAQRRPQSHKLEVEAMEAKHKAELAKLSEKHAKDGAPKPRAK